MKVALLLTGNELMTGDTVDSNSSRIAQSLALQGFDVAHKVTVGDDLGLIVRELQNLTDRYEIVIVNGGLGPTVDDLTAEALSILSGQALAENAEALVHVKSWCEARGVDANAANLKQTMLPADSAVLANPVGSAVGIQLFFNESLLLCTPGVPSELTAMLDGSITEALKRTFPFAKARLVRRLKLFGMGESSLQQLLADHCPDWPKEVTVGFRAGAPLLELKLEIDSVEHLHLRDDCEAQLQSIVGEFIVGENDDSLASVVVDLLQQRQQQITVAESCTGGMIASQITGISGVSSVFEAGFVTYSNTIKQQLLGVDSDLIQQYGSVSEDVVRAMALGALDSASADCVIAVSGIAGPKGGTAEKPVGTVWIAWGSKDNLQAQRFNYPVGRQFFQTMISALALDLVRRFLLGSTSLPDYFQRKFR